MIFYLGTAQPAWLARVGVPLFVSRPRLADRKSLPRAAAPWALDSGGFSELSLHGRWTVGAADYAAEVIRFRDEVGLLQWAAPRDKMCEPWIVEKTGESVEAHQRWTVDDFGDLRARGLPVIPVLQGWTLADYLRCVELYDRVGVDLRREPVVGLGSVCRRQATDEAVTIVSRLAGLGLQLHGFGFKLQGLARVRHLLASSDSMAWSFAARRRPPLPGHEVAGARNRGRCRRCAPDRPI